MKDEQPMSQAAWESYYFRSKDDDYECIDATTQVERCASGIV